VYPQASQPVSVVDTEQVVELEEPALGSRFLPRALRFATLQQHPAPSIRRRIEEHPEVLALPRQVLRASMQAERRIDRLAGALVEPRTIVLEREDLVAAALRRRGARRRGGGSSASWSLRPSSSSDARRARSFSSPRLWRTLASAPSVTPGSPRSMARSVGRDMPARSATRVAGSLRRSRARRTFSPTAPRRRETAGSGAVVERAMMDIILTTRPPRGKNNFHYAVLVPLPQYG
jgi:hypothetical protein